ncbi:MAG: SEL1-like repeat protein [Alphaproteobacteria bacterium]|uniref:tetratricopeptide repeat protein n=1 Tax=Maricaulis alexandrii TaxID=2570354 RepID=UPI001108F966|nr:SEL1-like repeat protein [Maricaulis alexandrii]MCR9266335.1 SEL1-like repeat protein [Alphaproteobacteria bacterium]
MLVRFSVCFALLLSAPFAGAQSLPDEEAPPAFPSELILLPQSVQDAANDGLDAEEAEVPSDLTPVDEAWYRAQIAYLGGDWFPARRYAENAAVAGHADAAALAGIMARDGIAQERNIPAAVDWFRRAAESRHPVALYQLGLLARLGDESLGLGTPRHWFDRAARAGHIDAMVAYALALRASGIPQEAVLAREWAERAAQQGSAEAKYQLAMMLDEGVGGPRDAEGARVWFERSAEANIAEGAFQAGMMWADGEGGPAGDVEARRWLRIAAESGYAPGQGQYGLMLYQGRGGEMDREAAAYWFGEGARGGDAESQYLYAFVLAQGDGVARDLETAYRWVVAAGTDNLGAPVHNQDRDRLQAALERVLPLDVQARMRELGSAD